MGSKKAVRGSCNKITERAEDDILGLLGEQRKSAEDTNKLLIFLKSEQLESMGDDKGLIKLLEEKHISRMWEITPDNRFDVASMLLPGVGQQSVNWFGKRGDWPSNWKGFPPTGRFKMIVTPLSPPNEYNVMWQTVISLGNDVKSGGNILPLPVTRKPLVIPAENKLILSVTSNLPNPLVIPEDEGRYVAKFTFGGMQGNHNNAVIVYIRWASPNVLVGKAYGENLGYLVLARDNNN